MSTRKFQIPVSGFPHGLNTEGSSLNLLPSELMEGSVNIELLRNGSIRRRRGVDFIGTSDAGGHLQTVRTSTVADEVKGESPSAVYVKLTAPNGSLVERLIVDINNEFHIFKVNNAGYRNFDTPFQTLTRGNNSNDIQKFHFMQYAQSGQRLYFAGLHINPGWLEVSSDNETLTINYFDVIVRDPDAKQVNSRVKKSISGVVRWFDCIEAHTADATNSPGDGTGDWTRYWMELDEAVPASVSSWTSSTAYTTTFIKRYNTLTTASTTNFYPTTVSFYAGRVWLAGDPAFPHTIYFSQVIQKDADINRFHQFADPFDSEDAELVDDDGGAIFLQGAGLVKQLITVGDSIFIGTNTGIFQISGPNGTFKATDFFKARVLDDEVNGPNNLLGIGQEFIVFGQDSIWLSQIETNLASSVAGKATFIDISESRINGFYKDIPKDNKTSSFAVYNGSDKTVYWFFNRVRTDFDASRGQNLQPIYSRNVLVFDTRFLDRKDVLASETLDNQLEQRQVVRNVKGSFYLYELEDGADSDKPYIAAAFLTPQTPTTTSIVVDNLGNVVVRGDSIGTSPVVDGADAATGTAVCDNLGNAVVDAGDPVLAGGSESKTEDTGLLVLQYSQSGTVVTIKGAIGTLNGTGLQDWSSSPTYKVSYSSTAKFGVQTMGNVLHPKGGIYLYLVFKKVESGILNISNEDVTPGGAFIRQAYQWSTTTTSARYSDQIPVYKPYRFSQSLAGGANDGHDHVWFKHRIRGRGNVLQFILENDGDKDFHLIGYNLQFWGKND